MRGDKGSIKPQNKSANTARTNQQHTNKNAMKFDKIETELSTEIKPGAGQQRRKQCTFDCSFFGIFICK